MKTRLYQPTPNAMQSGRATDGRWVLEFEPTGARRIDPLMGWTGSDDTGRQVRIEFDTMEEALAYAARSGLDCDVAAPHGRRVRPKSYSDNFRPDLPR